MTVGLNAAGIVGIARETTYGVYVAPTKFIPVRSETFEANNELIERRVIRNLAGVVGIVPGNLHYVGDMEIEVLTDIIPYFLNAARTSATQTGASPDFVYVFTPAHGALPSRSLSITVVRNGVVFGFVGCIVGSMEFSLDNGLLISRMSMLGAQESTQSLPTPTWPSTAPFGPGEYLVQIPTGTTVCDVDMSFTLGIEDNAVPEFRMCGTREAEFVRFGERSVNLSLARDFESRADFDAFKVGTAQSITIKATRTLPAPDSTEYIQFVMPSIIKNAYSVGLSSQGDLTRASIEYTVAAGAAVPEYTITVGSSESLAV
jgi:hypothetical protein